MTPRCMFVIQIAAFLRAQPYVYVTDAACPMFQRFELLFANKTVPRDSYRLETIYLGRAGFQPAFFFPARRELRKPWHLGRRFCW
jgi:hypothetical protein